MAHPRPKAVPPLSIAIVGVGKIGSTFAYQLALAGHDVTAVARAGSTRLRQLERDKGIQLRTGEIEATHVSDAFDEDISYDIVIITMLAHQIAPMLPALKRSKAHRLHFMAVNFEPESLFDALGERRCSFGMPAVMATLDANGKLKPTIGRQKTQHGNPAIVDVFNHAGIPSEFEPEMMLWLRSHAPITAAMESIAVAGRRRGGGASWLESRIVARGMLAGFAIIEKLGYRVYPRSKATMRRWPIAFIALLLWAFSRIKGMREQLSQGLVESRELVDAMLAATSASGLILSQETQAVLAMKPIVE